MRWWTGIGSRETPDDMLDLLQAIASAMAATHGLRSGGAPGADTACERGAIAAGGRKRIYLPWPDFEGRPVDDADYVVASTLPAARHAHALAAEFHPAWERTGHGARLLLGRNPHQLLGDALDEPSAFGVCWAPRPRVVDGRLADVAGGTGLAVRLGYARNVPFFHLGLSEHRRRLEAWLERR